jgi:hypothetical protein
LKNGLQGFFELKDSLKRPDRLPIGPAEIEDEAAEHPPVRPVAPVLVGDAPKVDDPVICLIQFFLVAFAAWRIVVIFFPAFLA